MNIKYRIGAAALVAMPIVLTVPNAATAQFPNLGPRINQVLGVPASLNMDTKQFDNTPQFTINNGQVRAEVINGKVYLVPLNGTHLYMAGNPTAANPWGCINPQLNPDYKQLEVGADTYYYCLMTSTNEVFTFTKGIANLPVNPKNPPGSNQSLRVWINYMRVGVTKP